MGDEVIQPTNAQETVNQPGAEPQTDATTEGQPTPAQPEQAPTDQGINTNAVGIVTPPAAPNASLPTLTPGKGLGPTPLNRHPDLILGPDGRPANPANRNPPEPADITTSGDGDASYAISTDEEKRYQDWRAKQRAAYEQANAQQAYAAKQPGTLGGSSTDIQRQDRRSMNIEERFAAMEADLEHIKDQLQQLIDQGQQAGADTAGDNSAQAQRDQAWQDRLTREQKVPFEKPEDFPEGLSPNEALRTALRQ